MPLSPKFIIHKSPSGSGPMMRRVKAPCSKSLRNGSDTIFWFCSMSVNNSMEEKNDFWEDLDGLIESISKEERIVLGADLNGHVGKGNIGDEEIMGRYGAGTRNKEGSMIVDFGKRMNLAIVNTYFKKKDEHRVTYKSGGKSTQVDYVMCRRRNLKEMCDCKVILNECVAKQHRMVVCKMALMVKKKKAEKVKPKIRWWKLKETSCQ